MHYVRNDTGSAFTYPLHIGPALERHQVTLAKAPTINIVDDGIFERLAGRRDATGKWRGGSASDYFNGQRLVITGEPPAKDPVHVVKLANGVTVTAQSRRARHREQAAAANADIAKQNAELLALLQWQTMDPELRKAQTEAEIAEIKARQVKAEAEIAEAEARKALASDITAGGLNPAEHKVDELRELVGAASIDEILGAIKIERARDGGPRKGAMDVLLEAAKG